MTASKENKWKAPFLRRYNKRKNPIIISREEVESALNDYLNGGGKVIKLKVDERLMKDIPIHFEDSYL